MSELTPIPFEQWQPLAPVDMQSLFQGAPFTWCLAGGYAVEQFVGQPLRPHDDIDVLVFRDEQLKLQSWLSGWQLYAADPPGALRPWRAGEYLPYGIHDIWGHQTNVHAWQMQIMLQEAEGEAWFSRRHAAIRGRKADFIRHYNGFPCIRIEIQLMYKAKQRRAKDEMDFRICLPLLDADAREWLRESLRILHPEGHPWLVALSETGTENERRT